MIISVSRLAAASLLLLLSSVATAVSANIEDPTAQARLLLKALSYDRALDLRVKSTSKLTPALRVGVVCHKESTCEEMATALETVGEAGIKGHNVDAEVVIFTSVKDLLALVDENEINALYVHTSVANALSSIQQVARAKKIPTLGLGAKLAEQGVSICAIEKGGKPSVAVNLRASKLEGMKLSAEFLKVSTVIR